MTNLDKNLISIDELKNVTDWVKRLEPNLLKDFITVINHKVVYT